METINPIEIDLFTSLITAAPGLIALLFMIIKEIINIRRQPLERRKLGAEAEKIDAETDKIQGDIYAQMIGKLEAEVARISGELKAERDARRQFEAELREIKNKQFWYEKYIRDLIQQLKDNDIKPLDPPTVINGSLFGTIK